MTVLGYIIVHILRQVFVWFLKWPGKWSFRVIKTYCEGVLIYLEVLIMESGQIGNILKSFWKLQLMPNPAASFLTNNKKIDHITLVLKTLNWFPVCKRTSLKLLF